MELELTVVSSTGRRDVLAQLDDGASVAQLRAALTADQTGTASAPGADGLWLADRYFDGACPVTAMYVAGLRSGVELSPDAPQPAPSRRTGAQFELATVGGLDAGGSARLTEPEAGAAAAAVVAGRSSSAGLLIRDAEVSRVHAAFAVAAGGRSVTVQDQDSRNGVGHRAGKLAATTDLPLGELVRLGESIVSPRAVPAVPADITEDAVTGGLAFNRPPSIDAPRPVPTLVEPAPPAKPKGFHLPWAAALLPLVMGGVIYFLFPQFGAYLLISMLLSPVLLVANAVSERRGGKRSFRTRSKEYVELRRRFDADLAAVLTDDERTSRADSPDPAELVRRALSPDAALWQRRRTGERFLDLRVGLADRPARVTVQRADSAPGTERQVPIAHDVPVTVPLRTVGVLGIAAPRPALLAAARALAVQVATLHSPGELGLVVLTGADSAEDWSWVTWLPHNRPLASQTGRFACRRLVAVDGDQAVARVAELQRLVDERIGQQRALLSDGPPRGRAIVLILDGARRTRAVPGLAKLLTSGPAVGVYAVCLDADETALPDECGATVVASTGSGTRARVRIGGREPMDDVLLDGLAASFAQRVSRALTPLYALGDAENSQELPDAVRFTELAAATGLVGAASGGDTEPGCEVAGADPEEIARRWRTGRSSKALLGTGPNGPLEIDLVKDGPHGLIAGTSGSGKSELLQTFVASLALGNHPDNLNFVLVDYKGGSAFAACAELPHCAGMITDLDGHLVTRALDSLSAELKRRETLLADAGAKDIADYWARTDAPLPRLVIVVDEFASLVEEVPEFVPGVVGIGMRGRSLGVHVVLATQRPGGVVSADMRANLNLRIALRVTSDAESNDVIDSPAAARILPRQPGRAYVRTGHSELVGFQAARVGWPLEREHDAASAGPQVVAVPRRIESLGQAPASGAADDVDRLGRTDLGELVQAMRTAAVDLGAGEPRRPWLPSLPEAIRAEDLPVVAHQSARAVVGVVDRPSRQAQEVFAIDLDRTGPVIIGGAVRSGRSTALRTIAASLAAAASPEDLHLYALDCGNHALAALEGLPHCGAVIDGADQTRTARLFALLAAEVTRRQHAFRTDGHGSLAEQRASAPQGTGLAHVVLLLDRLEAFVGRYEDVDNGALIDALELLLRTGPAVGITCVLATDRTGLNHRLGSAAAARLVLAQATPDDLMYFGVDTKKAPSRMAPGRAVWTPTGEEVQVAHLGADPSGTTQLARLRELAATLAHRWDYLDPHRRPHRLDLLPETIDPAAVEDLRSTPRPGGAGVVTLGVGGDHLAPVDLDLAALGGCFVICGAGRTGRSTALHSIVESLETDLPVVIVAPRPSPLRDLAGTGRTVIAGPNAAADLLAELADDGPRVLVIDDAERLDDLDLAPALDFFVRSARDTGSLVIAAATTEDVLTNRYRGWLATARRDRAGLLLNPATHVDGEVFDLRLPRSLSGSWPAGRALLVRGGETSTVQVTNATPAPVG